VEPSSRVASLMKRDEIHSRGGRRRDAAELPRCRNG
jgi:hypothetical protein